MLSFEALLTFLLILKTIESPCRCVVSFSTLRFRFVLVNKVYIRINVKWFDILLIAVQSCFKHFPKNPFYKRFDLAQIYVSFAVLESMSL